MSPKVQQQFGIPAQEKPLLSFKNLKKKYVWEARPFTPATVPLDPRDWHRATRGVQHAPPAT